jgi:hypothetical protein
MHERDNIFLVMLHQCVQRGVMTRNCGYGGHASSEDSVAPETGGVSTDKGRVEAIRVLRIASGKVSCKWDNNGSE